MAETNNSATASSRGVGWLGLLGVVFVILKLNPGGYLDSPVQGWSWWLVTLPFYLVFAILLAVAVLGGIGYLIASGVDKRNAKKRREQAAARRNNRYLGR